MKPRAPTLSLRHLRGADLESTLRSLGLHLRATDVESLVGRLEREPTQAELALLDSMWSEHCSYKSSRALLRRLPTQAPQVVLGPGADAGIVRLPRWGDDGKPCLQGSTHCIAVGHESHNHPSQLLPFEGAATGIGGIVRDVYCMGADVVGVLDALRFGDPDGPQGDVVLQIVRGVVDGIAHYGNALGVPNVGGEVEFDSRFDDNCLVNVVALGILEESDLVPSRAPALAGDEDYVVLLVGKPTDDSGLGGAAFASGILDTDEETQERGAVQLPDPFFKRVLTEANRAAFDFLRRSGHAFAVKDLGAAGLAGAATEMAGSLGLQLDLDAVHADRRDRPAAVLLVAETQERYVFAIPEALAEPLRRIFEEDFELGAMVRGAGVRIIGRFDCSGRVRAVHQGQLHVDLPTEWITQVEEIHWPRSAARALPRTSVTSPAAAQRSLQEDLERVVGSRGGASRWSLYGHYDSDVQGRTSQRPGDADAGVLVPWRQESLAVAIGLGGAARLSKGDGYRAGAAAVCESVRNVVAVGTTPWALTDCLNFGSPENPECMADLEACVQGLADAAGTLGVRGLPGHPLPFVSGNVSLYNESRSGRAIPPTPIVACFGVAADVGRVRGMALKEAGDLLLRVGPWSEALGGSLYAEVTGQQELLKSALPDLDLEREARQARLLLDAYDAGLIRACRDTGVGGVLLALLEMSFGRRGEVRLGIRCHVPEVTVAMLFAEAPGYVCAIAAESLRRFTDLCEQHDVEWSRIGTAMPDPVLQIQVEGEAHELALESLGRRWSRGLQDVLLEEAAR